MKSKAQNSKRYLDLKCETGVVTRTVDDKIGATEVYDVDLFMGALKR